MSLNQTQTKLGKNSGSGVLKLAKVNRDASITTYGQSFNFLPSPPPQK